MAPATSAAPTRWTPEELDALKLSESAYEEAKEGVQVAKTKYNPTPGTGRTGYMPIPPNNYPFYNDDEKYVPVIQPDGGQLSDWKALYQPTKEQEDADRARAYETGVPHGYVPRGFKYEGMPTIDLVVRSELHDDGEYGANVDANGKHTGGPFTVSVSPKMTVEDLRLVIRDKGGILPGLQRLSYAGKKMEDCKRTLEHYGITYWHAKFPHWPITVRKFA